MDKERRITAEEVIAGYMSGYFPMAVGREKPIEWFMAEPRTILPLDDRFKVRRSLRQTMKQLDYQIRIDSDFDAVIRACARHHEVPDREVWLSEEMIDLYTELHHRGFAHSVEVWTSAGLVGGLYGIALRRLFLGESMFSRISSASQIALVALVERLRHRGFSLLDVQMRTPHIALFGAIDLTHKEYLRLLEEALGGDARFSDL
jgi:leucyl/phenylalanyl-tRNA--protein transferase